MVNLVLDNIIEYVKTSEHDYFPDSCLSITRYNNRLISFGFMTNIPFRTCGINDLAMFYRTISHTNKRETEYDYCGVTSSISVPWSRHFLYVEDRKDRLAHGRICIAEDTALRRTAQLMEHWQSKEQCFAPATSKHPISGDRIVMQEPGGVTGLSTPSAIKHNDGYVYIFYTRRIQVRAQNFDPRMASPPYFGYAPYASKLDMPSNLDFLNRRSDSYDHDRSIKYYNDVQANFVTAICLARLPYDTVRNVQIEELAGMVERYDNGQFDSKVYDTAVTPAREFCAEAKVTWNTHTDSFLMVGQNQKRNGFKFFVSDRGDPTSWTLLREVFVGNDWSLAYPSLVRNDGSTDKVTEKEFWLYFAEVDTGSTEPGKLARTKVKLQ